MTAKFDYTDKSLHENDQYVLINGKYKTREVQIISYLSGNFLMSKYLVLEYCKRERNSEAIGRKSAHSSPPGRVECGKCKL